MPKGILGKKIGVTQRFGEDGEVIPLTVVQAGPCVVVQRKTKERDGYDAVQVGLVEPKRASCGTPSAAPRCMAPESLLISRRASAPST